MPKIETAPPRDLFRTETSKGADRVDRKANVIVGANLMQIGDLNGGDVRDWTVDQGTLESALAFMLQGNNGTKARYTHPNMSSDGMGSFLGRWKNPRIEDDTLRADLHVAEAAFNSPQGDLGTYILDLAEEDPEAFGVSLATRLDEDNLQEFEEEQRAARQRARLDGEELPERQKWPMRFSAIRAGDVVDEPAATRGGFFSLTEVDNRNLPAQATALLDSYFSEAEPEVVSARINGFLETYFNGKGKRMTTATPEQQTAPAAPAIDLEAERKAAADLARKEERSRQTEIVELCNQAGKPELAAKFCEDGTPVPEVQSHLFKELCKSNPPVGDEGDGPEGPSKSDPDAEYKAEFAALPPAEKTMTLDQFVSLRRAEDGLEPFIKAK